MTAQIKNQKLEPLRLCWKKPRLAELPMSETAIGGATNLDSDYNFS